MPKIDPIINQPSELTLKSSQLLYKCDISLKKEVKAQQLLLSAQGILRVGPKRSEVSAKAVYNIVNDSFEHLLSESQLTGFLIKENNNRMASAIDPLLFFFIIFHLKSLKQDSQIQKVLIGGKIRDLKLSSNTEGTEVLYKNKPWAQIKNNTNATTIKIKKIKATLTLVANTSARMSMSSRA